jgi:hypothetical protein
MRADPDSIAPRPPPVAQLAAGRLLVPAWRLRGADPGGLPALGGRSRRLGLAGLPSAADAPLLRELRFAAGAAKVYARLKTAQLIVAARRLDPPAAEARWRAIHRSVGADLFGLCAGLGGFHIKVGTPPIYPCPPPRSMPRALAFQLSPWLVPGYRTDLHRRFLLC